jgi:hypothetical protein
MRWFAGTKGEMRKAGTLSVLTYDWDRRYRTGSEYIPYTQSGKVVGNMMIIRLAVKSDAILRLGNIHRRRNVVSEAAVLVKVDNQQAIVSY